MRAAARAGAIVRESDAELYSITRHTHDDAVVAVRAGQVIARQAFLRDVAALAARLPAHRYVLNLCTDRYRFMVGFAAALCRRQISLLPPGAAPGIFAAMAVNFPDLYALTDGTAPAGLPQLPYPTNLHNGAVADVTEVPAAQPALILFTSGSTGMPAPVPKTWGVLVRSAQAAGQRLGVGPRGTIIGTVPHQHSYGLESTILLALQNGLSVEAGSPLYPADINALIAAARPPKILVTTPVHLKTLVEEPGGMVPVDLIVSATAPLSAALAARAESCFGAPLIEIYGCTEAGQVATRRTVHDTAWHCFNGVILQTSDGRNFAAGPAVEGIAPLQDEIEPAGPGMFRLGGRSADVADVAGKRASLAYLNHLLASIDGVQDAVFFMTAPRGKAVARLAALVVAPSLRPQDILSALRRLTDAAFLPRPLVMMDKLPRNAVGKLSRETLLQAISQDSGRR